MQLICKCMIEESQLNSNCKIGKFQYFSIYCSNNSSIQYQWLDFFFYFPLPIMFYKNYYLFLLLYIYHILFFLRYCHIDRHLHHWNILLEVQQKYHRIEFFITRFDETTPNWNWIGIVLPNYYNWIGIAKLFVMTI